MTWSPSSMLSRTWGYLPLGAKHAGEPIPEVARLGRTLKAWKREILAYWHTDRSNAGPTEAINNVIETTRRIARGFRNFDNYRLRILASASGQRPYRQPPKLVKQGQPNHAELGLPASFGRLDWFRRPVSGLPRVGLRTRLGSGSRSLS